MDVDEKRKKLEEEASAITEELTASIDGKKPMGISTPLVDEEGYPRNDIDVYRARNLRKRLNEIRFDHAALMKDIEGSVYKNVSLSQLCSSFVVVNVFSILSLLKHIDKSFDAFTSDSYRIQRQQNRRQRLEERKSPDQRWIP